LYVPGCVFSLLSVVDLQFYPITGFTVSEEYGIGFGAVREDADFVVVGASGAIHVIPNIFCFV